MIMRLLTETRTVHRYIGPSARRPPFLPSFLAIWPCTAGELRTNLTHYGKHWNLGVAHCVSL